MKKAVMGARLLLGLVFVVFGLNGFLQFLPMPPMAEPAMNFVGALAATGYFFPVLKGAEIIGGALLLSGKAVPFALVWLAPIVLNIFLFHLLVAGGPAMAIVILALELFLAWSYRSAYKGLFK